MCMCVCVCLCVCMLINLEHLMIVLPRLGRRNWYSVWPQAVRNRDCVCVCMCVCVCV